MHTCYLDVPGAVGVQVRLSEEETKHAVRVLRLTDGETVCATDVNGQRFEALIGDTDAKQAMLTLTEALPDNEPPVRITLYQGLPKADKLELITQKATELGAACIVPVKMERCVVHSDAKDGVRRRERLEKIAREAAKQCRRGTVPEISEPLTWKQCADRMRAHDLLMVPWEEARDIRMSTLCRERPEARDIGIVIGPEGGMSASETEAIGALGGCAITLGPRILRAETAAIAAVTMAMTLWGDL